ncbi:MAG: di-heme oxidoredictase family protein [Candidatus Binatia bacterium]
MHTQRRTGLPHLMGTFVLVSTAAAAEFGDPLRGLTPAELERFTAGREAFAQVETAADGLGPVFNGTSCGGCHDVGAIGGGSELVETRFGTVTDGVFDPLAGLGGSLIQTDGIGVQGACTFVGEVVPPQATIVAGRRTTPLFGLGLVDAVPDAELVALARQQARFRPQTAGRPNFVTDVATGLPAIGKFGWKSQVPSLLHFSADAYLNEMGITTPLFPDESCPQGDCTLLVCDPVPGVDDDLEDVESFRDFMAFLAPPPPVRAGGATWQGGRLFAQVGCGDCHVPALVTGRSEVAALRRRILQPYSDFLLHDMGSLGDGIEQGQATGREMRTAPLWGVRLMTTFLHDGRAHSIAEAILAHDGQGRRARDGFAALSAEKQTRLVAFVRGR